MENNENQINEINEKIEINENNDNIEEDKSNKNIQNQDLDNSYISFSPENNNYIFLDPGVQAGLINYLMETLDFINKVNSLYNPLTKGIKFKSLEKYNKYLSQGNEQKNKLKLIKNLYKVLYNEKNPPELNGTLPEDLILVINLKNLYEICDYIAFSLNCIYKTKNSDTKIMKLIQGEMSWKDACTKTNFKNNDEVIKLDKCVSFLDTINCFNCFNLELTKDLNENQDVYFEKILLFYLFYEALLQNCLKISIDMSMEALDKYYNTNKMKEKIYTINDENVIKEINPIYLKGLLANYIIIRGIGEYFSNKEGLLLTYKQNESYILEIYSLLGKEIDDSKFLYNYYNYENCNYIYYNILYSLSPKTYFSLNLNALDPLTFKNSLYTIFLILNNGEPIQNIDINLFPREYAEKKINIHKIYFDYIYYTDMKNNNLKNLLEIKYNFDNHKEYNWKGEDNADVIAVNEDKIYDLLFEEFRMNLFYLFVLIDKNSLTLKESINLNLPQCLLSKKKYVYSTASFIYNILNFLYKKNLSINMSQFKLVSNIQIPESLCKFKILSLKNIKINKLSLKIDNISFILDLNDLPYNTCNFLCLSNISNEDLIKLINALRAKINEETILNHLEIKFNYSLNNNFNFIDDMLRNYSFPKSVSHLVLKYKNEFSKNEYCELMWRVINAMACSDNNPKELEITIRVFYDPQEDPIQFYNLKQSLISCFDFDKLNPEYLLIYNMYLKENKTKKENIVIVEMNKYKRSTRLDAFIKLSRAFDKGQILDTKYIMPTCLRIIRFITNFEIESNITINFVFRKSQ